jgi:hypothetical protein
MGIAEIFAVVVGEVAAANAVEVVVEEPKQISTGLARMSAMLHQIGPPCCTASS